MWDYRLSWLKSTSKVARTFSVLAVPRQVEAPPVWVTAESQGPQASRSAFWIHLTGEMKA